MVAVPTQPRRRRSGLPLLAILVVLVAALVVADRLAAAAANDRIRVQVVAALAKHNVQPRSTDVTVDGFPFLTQVADGRFQQITIDMADVAYSGVVLPSLHVVARDVRADAADLVGGSVTATADRVTGTAVVDWTTLTSLVDYARLGLSDVRFSAVDGALEVTGTANIGGARVPLSALADLTVNAGVVQISLREAQIGGAGIPGLGQAQVNALLQRLTVQVPIPPLPFQLAIDAVQVQTPGLTVTATARGVSLVS